MHLLFKLGRIHMLPVASHVGIRDGKRYGRITATSQVLEFVGDRGRIFAVATALKNEDRCFSLFCVKP